MIVKPSAQYSAEDNLHSLPLEDNRMDCLASPDGRGTEKAAREGGS